MYYEIVIFGNATHSNWEQWKRKNCGRVERI